MSLIASARSLLERVPGKRVAVALSGGKDSVALLDLAVRFLGKENVGAFFMQVAPTRLELRRIEFYARRVGVRCIVVPHWSLPNVLKGAVYRTRSLETDKLRLLRPGDIERYVRKKLGTDWVAIGEKASDSTFRNAKLRKWQGLCEKGRRVYALWNWKDKDVFAYLGARGIQVPKPLGPERNDRMNGLGLDGPTLLWMREAAPDDYALILRWFPLAEAAVIREEKRRRAEAQSQDAGGEARKG